MNCKPGDVAYVVRSLLGDPCTLGDIGTPIETKTMLLTPLGAAWMLPVVRRCGHCGRWRDGYFDAELQPMRPAPPAGETVREIIEEVSA